MSVADKIVGLDLDGVIIDHTDVKIRAAKILGIDLRPEDTPPEILKSKLSIETYGSLKYMIYDSPLAFEAVLMDGAKDALERIKSSGSKYYLISQRKNPIESQKHLVSLGLWEAYFNSQNTFFVPKDGDKNNTAKRLGVDIYIDDQVRVLRSLEVEGKFLFDPLDVHQDANWYQRIRTWSEFLELIGAS